MSNDKIDSYILKSKEDEIKSLTAKIKQTAHDLNNLLTISTNSIAAIKQLINPDDNIHKYITNIEINSLRATEIVEELLASEGIGERHKRRINVNDLIDDVIKSLRGSIRMNVELHLDIDKKLHKVEGFYSDLYRAFLNLAINACEAIDEEGIITLTAKKNSKSVILSFKDTGCGIGKNSLTSIFNDGYSTKNKMRASGLGLYIVKNIVEAHNGFISVKSEVGKGTEFLVTLPVAKSVKKSPKNKIKKILIAEDEAPILESISYLLESYNYETYCAANGLLALEKYEANEDIDLLIIDKLMPGMDGIKVIKKIRERNKIVPIILTTGLQDADETKLKKIGVSKVLKKPYDFDLLIELIRGTSL